ncbi:MAG: sugar transferase [Ornithinimicrobium sp.]
MSGPSTQTGWPVGSFRRVLDVVVASTALVALAPVGAAIGVAIRVTSPGPVVFHQQRIGRGGAEFTILKFRTMGCHHAGSDLTARQDARVTRVGAVLRRTSLDELPQLINVLRGDMTLVGPRPETVDLSARYPPSTQWVLQHTPGITGPTQIWLRDSATLPEVGDDPEEWYLRELVPRRVRCDWEYLRDPSPTATVSVLAQTAAYLIGGPWWRDLVARRSIA